MSIYAKKCFWISLLPTEDLIYRIDDSPQGVEATQHGKHMLDGVCNGGQLKQRVVKRYRWRKESRIQVKLLVVFCCAPWCFWESFAFSVGKWMSYVSSSSSNGWTVIVCVCDLDICMCKNTPVGLSEHVGDSVLDGKLWIIMMKLKNWFLFQTRCSVRMEKHAKLPEAAGIHGTGRGLTCVSLKSLTPTQ